MKTIRLLLVEDHDVVRTGLKSFLEAHDDFIVVGEARNGREAIEQALNLQPDVVIMDITMPEMDGLEANRQLKDRFPECQVLALTVHEDKQYFFEMLACGASGYLTKRAAAQELVAAIHTVAEGNVYLQPTLASWLLDDYRRLVSQVDRGYHRGEIEPGDDVGPGLDVLSTRELQVLEMVAEGLTSPQIAEQLGISPRTVSRHRERIMNKLNLHSSAQLVKFAIRSGLIELR